MPVGFLSDEQAQRYGRYSGDPSPEQLARYFHLDDTDRAFVGSRRGEHMRLGCAVQLGTVRFLGTFLEDPCEVPAVAVRFVAAQLGLDGQASLDGYRTSPWRWRHPVEIRVQYGYRDFSEGPVRFRLHRWLYALCWTGPDRPGALFDRATAWLVSSKVVLPGASTLERVIARVRGRANRRFWRFWRCLAEPLDPEQKQRLEALLVPADGARQSALDRLRTGPTRASIPGLVRAADRLEEVRRLADGLPATDHLPQTRVLALARFAGSARAHGAPAGGPAAGGPFSLRPHLPPPIRAALLEASGPTPGGRGPPRLDPLPGRPAAPGPPVPGYLRRPQPPLRGFPDRPPGRTTRPTVCRTLGHSPVAAEAVGGLTARLDQAYRAVAAHLPRNGSVRFEPEGDGEALVLTGLDRLEEPATLVALREAVAARLPRVELPEKRVPLRTAFPTPHDRTRGTVIAFGALAVPVTRVRRWQGFAVHDEDLARLSPLGSGHINMLGRYSFNLPDCPTGSPVDTCGPCATPPTRYPRWSDPLTKVFGSVATQPPTSGTAPALPPPTLPRRTVAPVHQHRAELRLYRSGVLKTGLAQQLIHKYGVVFTGITPTESST
ncbi:protein of unknown function [Methylomagnum ishizawai]|uniref:DUF4158 domain-containing protein n=1 Tax=Methylomagnum ishizawai TaxID=1760988 RepID=A0A1Y6D5C5_9GAMM|nr:protein of unknown function [Methylomagnum ishizawai]